MQKVCEILQVEIQAIITERHMFQSGQLLCGRQNCFFFHQPFFMYSQSCHTNIQTRRHIHIDTRSPKNPESYPMLPLQLYLPSVNWYYQVKLSCTKPIITPVFQQTFNNQISFRSEFEIHHKTELQPIHVSDGALHGTQMNFSPSCLLYMVLWLFVDLQAKTVREEARKVQTVPATAIQQAPPTLQWPSTKELESTHIFTT